MKAGRLIVYLALAGMVLLAGCGRPKIIEDDDLLSILEEIYLTNAYHSNNRSNVENLDSLDEYSSIFNKYGYRASDLQYTLEDFSRRKSASFSDVLTELHKHLDSVYKFYEARVAMHDTVDTRSLRLTRKVVYSDSLIDIRALRDTTKLKIRLAAEQGKYEITYGYTHDSTDKNNNLRAQVTVFDAEDRQQSSLNRSIRRSINSKENMQLATQEGADTLQLLLANYTKDSKTPIRLRFESLEIVHFPPIEAARDSLFRDYMKPFRIKITEPDAEPEKDSLALPVHAPWLLSKRDSIH